MVILGLVDVFRSLLGRLEKPLERVLLVLLVLVLLPSLPPPLLRLGVLDRALAIAAWSDATLFLGGSNKWSNLVSLLDSSGGRWILRTQSVS